MLANVHPLLTGTLLSRLDAMGHSDAVLVCDAHFPAARLVGQVIDMPGVTAAEVVAAICTVLPLDEPVAASLMDGGGTATAVQDELRAACGAPAEQLRTLPRAEFYDVAAGAVVAVRSGEVRAFGNLLLHKGVIVRDHSVVAFRRPTPSVPG